MKNTNMSPKPEEAQLVEVIRLAENSSQNTKTGSKPFSEPGNFIKITLSDYLT
jgi:hypothetical protein